MKRLLALILAVFMIFGTFVACGDEEPVSNDDEQTEQKDSQTQTETETDTETETQTETNTETETDSQTETQTETQTQTQTQTDTDTQTETETVCNHFDSDADGDHLCDNCADKLGECADADKDHKCDECTEVVSSCDDTNSDHLCDVCRKILSFSEGLSFNKNTDGEGYTLAGIGTCTDTNIVIPKTYDGLPITGIGESAFKNFSALVSVVIPDSITSVGNSAFRNCGSLTDVYYDGDITSWCNIGFSDLYASPLNNEAKLYFKNSLGEYEALTELVIPDTVTEIKAYAFYNCCGIVSVTIGSGVISIGDYAFYNCRKLAEVINRSTLDIKKGASTNGSVGYYALEIHIGDSKIANKDGYLFYSCDSVNYLVSYIGAEKDIILPEAYNGENYVINKYAFYKNSDIAKITFSKGVEKIGAYAFTGCLGLVNVSIGDCVKEIGEYSFEGCTALVSVTVGNGCETIGSCAFRKCKALTSVTIGNGVKDFGDSVFIDTAYYNDKANWENGVLYIGVYLIGSELSVSGEYTVKEGTRIITQNAFWGRTGLGAVTIPESVICIDNGAFKDCTSLVNITVGSGVKALGNDVFNNTGYYNSTYNWQNGVLYVGNYLIKAKTSLSGEYTVKDGTKIIASYAFDGCTQLSGVKLPDSIVSIDLCAFRDCIALSSVYYNGDAGSWCNITFATEDANPLYDSHVGKNTGAKLYFKNSSDIYELVTVLVIPDAVNEIKPYSFAGCTSIAEVTVGKGVKSIGYYSFYNCVSLTKIDISESVETIDYSAFYICSKLISINVDENNASYKSAEGNLYTKDGKTLVQYAIGKSDTSFVIAEEIEIIDYYAFVGCTALSEVEFKNTEGWSVSSLRTAETKNISSDDLADKAVAAKYLTDNYKEFCWFLNPSKV